MTLKDLAEFGHMLGHSATDVLPTASGARFTVACSCGYESTTRRTQADAIGAIVHHLRGVVLAFHRTGRDLPAQPLREPFGVSHRRVTTAG